jgi:hypothetical protein
MLVDPDVICVNILDKLGKLLHTIESMHYIYCGKINFLSLLGHHSSFILGSKLKLKYSRKPSKAERGINQYVLFHTLFY